MLSHRIHRHHLNGVQYAGIAAMESESMGDERDLPRTVDAKKRFVRKGQSAFFFLCFLVASNRNHKGGLVHRGHGRLPY